MNMRMNGKPNLLPFKTDCGKPLRVVLSSVSSDSHTWNLVFLQLYLEYFGHFVVNLGACVPDEEVITTCLREQPDLLVVSTVNGHGYIDGERLIKRVRTAPLLTSLASVIGGKLGIYGEGNSTYVDQLLQAGYDAVFEDSRGLDQFNRYLRALSIKKGQALAEDKTATTVMATTTFHEMYELHRAY